MNKDKIIKMVTLIIFVVLFTMLNQDVNLKKNKKFKTENEKLENQRILFIQFKIMTKES